MIAELLCRAGWPVLVSTEDGFVCKICRRREIDHKRPVRR